MADNLDKVVHEMRAKAHVVIETRAFFCGKCCGAMEQRLVGGHAVEITLTCKTPSCEYNGVGFSHFMPLASVAVIKSDGQ